VNNTQIIPSSLSPKQHVKKMKMIQFSSSSLSDFISPISYYEEVPDDLKESKTFNTNGLQRSHCSSNPIPRRTPELSSPIDDNHYLKKQKSEEKTSSDSSSSSDLILSSDEKLLSRSDFILQQEQNIPQQCKSSSLKTISMISPQLSSKILYPIDFQINNIDQTWHKKQSHKVPTSDSGIVIDTQPTSKSGIEEVCISKNIF
jgi:hypothetical protein